MSAAALALRHGRALLFISVCAALGGLLSASRLPKGVYPEVTFLREQVVASLGGAPAATVLAGLTRPLESQLATVPGVWLQPHARRSSRSPCASRPTSPTSSRCAASCAPVADGRSRRR